MNDKPVTTLEQKKDRRGLLALIGAGGAAAVAALFSRSNGAQAKAAVLQLGGDNDAGTSQTGLKADVPETPDPGLTALLVTNLASEPGPGGEGVGIHGRASRHGVMGTTVDGPSGVVGFDFDIGPGGLLEPGPDANPVAAVLGFGQNRGVVGLGLGGIGVSGWSPGDSAAVEAVSGDFAFLFGEAPFVPDNGLALEVVGKARFSSAAMTELPPGAKQHTVSDPHVQGSSLVLTTLHSDPGKGVAIAWVKVAAKGGSFKVHLSDKSKKPIKLCYFVLN